MRNAPVLPKLSVPRHTETKKMRLRPHQSSRVSGLQYEQGTITQCVHDKQSNTANTRLPTATNLVRDEVRVQEGLVLGVGELVAVVLVHGVRPEHVAQGTLHLWLHEAVDVLDLRQVLNLQR